MPLMLVVIDQPTNGPPVSIVMSQDARVIEATLREIVRLAHQAQEGAPDDDIFRRLGLRPDGE